jgi:hypothetical protein
VLITGAVSACSEHLLELNDIGWRFLSGELSGKQKASCGASGTLYILYFFTGPTAG